MLEEEVMLSIVHNYTEPVGFPVMHKKKAGWGGEGGEVVMVHWVMLRGWCGIRGWVGDGIGWRYYRC
jgi:hypothetical protein